MSGDDSNATSILGHVDRGMLGAVQDLFRTAGRGVRTRLVNRSGADVPVRVGAAELMSLGAVQDRIQSQEGGAFVAFRIEPWDLPGMLVIEGPLLFRLVGILLGEDTGGESPLYRYRTLTRVDLRLARRVAEDALDGLADALRGSASNAAFRVERVSGSPRWSLPLPRSSTILEATLDLGPPSDPYGLLSFVLPAQIARQLLPGIGPKHREAHRVGMQRVLPLPVTAVAELARVKLPLERLKSLEVGSMIDLGPVHEVRLRVGGKDTIVAEPGERNGVRSIRVLRRVEPNRDPEDAVPSV